MPCASALSKSLSPKETENLQLIDIESPSPCWDLGPWMENRLRHRMNPSAVTPCTPRFASWEAHVPPGRSGQRADEARGCRGAWEV